MKYLISSLLFSITMSVSASVYADDVILSDIKDLTFKTEDGIETVYGKDGKLYSGAVVIPDSEGRKITYIYNEGKKEGVAFSRFGTGKFELEITYAAGYKNGEEIMFYPNNNPMYKKTYKNDILNGEELLFYQNGKPQRKANYVDGKFDGEVHYFDEKGDPIRIETYKQGIKNGKEHIIEDNILREENHYVDGKLEGITKKYGSKYLTDEIEYKDGKRNGIHKIYKEDGSWLEIPYVDDKKQGQGNVYYPDKTLAGTVVYINDMRNGPYKKFSHNGQIIVEENYKNDLKNGISRYLDDKGKLQSVSYYADDVEISSIDINNNDDLKNIQNAFFNKQFDKYSNKRNLWYKILWLVLNTNQPEMLRLLEKEMKMYAANINDMTIYQKYSGNKFEEETQNFYFGLSPLNYATNLELSSEYLQKLINQIEIKNSRGLTPLWDAVRLNKTDMVKYLLLNGADINGVDNHGNNILMYAINEGSSPDIIKNIIKSGIDINAHNNDGQTALVLAINQKDVQTTDILLKSEPNLINRQNEQNILFYAYDKKAPIEIINTLIENGVDINSTDTQGSNLLLNALKNKDDSTALYAIEKGADINQYDQEGENAVSFVLFNEVDPEVIKAVFSKDYDVNHRLAKSGKMLWKILLEQNKLDLLEKVWSKMPDIAAVADENGEIPIRIALHITDNPQLRELALSYIKKADHVIVWDALKNKDIDLFRELISKQADVNAKNEDNEPMLIYMVKNEYSPEFMDIINNQKLNIDETDNQNMTALDYAINKNDLKIIDYLLQSGADPDRTIDGKTYIEKAQPSQFDLVNLLIKHNASLSPSATNDQPMIMLAVKNLNRIVLEKLAKQEDADFDVKDDNGNTLLLSLADYFEDIPQTEDSNILTENFIAMAKILLDKGLDINQQNGNGETLLIKMAKYAGNSYNEITEFLINNGAETKTKDQYGKTAEDYRKDKG